MLLLKATLILALAALSGIVLRRSAATTRHRLWSWAFIALLALPLLAATLPVLTVPVSDRVAQTLVPAPKAAPIPAPIPARAASDTVAPSAFEAPVATSTFRSRLSTTTLLFGLWWAGTLLALLALTVSVLRVHWLSRSAMAVDDTDWMQRLATISTHLGLRTPVAVKLSPRVLTPMAGGLFRPTVFLPSSAADWSAEQRDVVLAHELAHLAARDPHRHLLARLAVSLYWFHPLAWFAARQATAAREAACDEKVLALGTKPSAYARVLVDLAESLQATPRGLATLPMVHKSSLEVRVMAILNGSTRPSSKIRGTVAVLALTFGTLVVAAAAPPDTQNEPSARRFTELRRTLREVRSAIDKFKELASSVPSIPIAPAARPGETSQGNRAATDCAAGHDGESFSGSISTDSRNVVHERIGTLNQTHRIVLFSVDGIRLCLFGESVGVPESADPPSRWIGRARRLVMELSSAGTTQRMAIEGTPAQITWQVNGATRPVDRAATEWRDRMLAMFDAQWEMTSLRGQATSLRGEITSVRGEETSLRGEITSLRGEVTSMQGDVTSIWGELTSMQGRITSARGHETSLRGQITSERGAITSIRGGGSQGADADRRVAEHERQIERIEKEIRDYNAEAKVAEIEKEIERFDAHRKAAEVEKQIKAFDVERKVADVERRITELNVDDKVRGYEREIEKLDADRRIAEIERRIEAERPKLKAAIAAAR